jgi:hypothetical protein
MCSIDQFTSVKRGNHVDSKHTGSIHFESGDETLTGDAGNDTISGATHRAG